MTFRYLTAPDLLWNAEQLLDHAVEVRDSPTKRQSVE
jgi:hypothetical protein